MNSSAVTALIYSATFVIYAALEGQILATSIHHLWALPIGVWYVVVGAIFIPLTWYGMTQISATMWVSFPIYLVLIIVAIVTALNRHGGFPAHLFNAAPAHSVGGTLGIVGVLAGLAGTIGLNPLEFSDYARFVKPERFRRTAWLTIVLPYALMFFVAFPMGMLFTLLTGGTNPGIYFVSLLGLGLGVLFAWVTQVRINLTNVYSGSMALSNFVARTTGWTPSRIVWVAVIAAGSIGLMFANILGHLLDFLEWDGIFLMSWVGTVVCDLLIVRRFMHVAPPQIECERSRMWLINPVGPVALIVAVAVGSALHYGGQLLRQRPVGVHRVWDRDRRARARCAADPRPLLPAPRGRRQRGAGAGRRSRSGRMTGGAPRIDAPDPFSGRQAAAPPHRPRPRHRRPCSSSTWSTTSSTSGARCPSPTLRR